MKDIRHRIKPLLTTLAVTGALVGGGAALASAATSTTSSTPSTTTSTPTQTTPAPGTGQGRAPRGAAPNGSHHCPHMGQNTATNTSTPGV